MVARYGITFIVLANAQRNFQLNIFMRMENGKANTLISACIENAKNENGNESFGFIVIATFHERNSTFIRKFLWN